MNEKEKGNPSSIDEVLKHIDARDTIKEFDEAKDFWASYYFALRLTAERKEKDDSGREGRILSNKSRSESLEPYDKSN